MAKKRNPNGPAQGGGGDLTDDERRALRGSKFAPLPSSLPSSSSSHHHPRLAHPGGAMTTNKAAALAKFLERKLQQPGGLDSINPELLELAVKNAKDAVNAGGSSGTIVRHVASFDDPNEELEEAAPRNENLVVDKNQKETGNHRHKLKQLKQKKKKRKKQEQNSEGLGSKKRKNKRK